MGRWVTASKAGSTGRDSSKVEQPAAAASRRSVINRARASMLASRKSVSAGTRRRVELARWLNAFAVCGSPDPYTWPTGGLQRFGRPPVQYEAGSVTDL